MSPGVGELEGALHRARLMARAQPEQGLERRVGVDAVAEVQRPAPVVRFAEAWKTEKIRLDFGEEKRSSSWRCYRNQHRNLV